MSRRPSVPRLLWLLVAGVATVQAVALGSDWPQWRGPLGTGVAPDARPPVRWSASENIRWKTAVPGRGHSTPIVSGQRIFLTTAVPVGPKFEPRPSDRPGAHDNLAVDSAHQYRVIAIDRTSGNILWSKVVHETIPREGGHYTASLASASPVTDGTYVYALFGSAGLYCLDFAGNIVWEKQFGEMHSKHGHGEGASPALHDQTLVVNWDHEEQSFLVALDKHSGQERWRRNRAEVTSWSTPLIVEVDSGTQVIVCGTDRVRGYDLESGEIIWQCGGMSANIVATPVAAGGILLAGSSYEKQTFLAIRLSGARGDITDTDHVLWSRSRGTPYVPSPLLYGDVVYFLAHYQNVLSRVEAASGQDAPGAIRLGPLGNIYASPVAAGGHVYITDLDGTTLVLSDSAIPRSVAVNPIGESVKASAAIAGDELYLRGERHLFCIARQDTPDRR